MFLSLIKYIFCSKDEHSIHSPFLFSLYCDVIKKKVNLSFFEKIETIRNQLLNSNQIVNFDAIGAKSRLNFNSNKRKVKEIAKTSLSTQKYSILHYKLISYFKPQNILEIGTSLGINTLYMWYGNKNAHIYTFEGNETVVDLAKKNFDLLSADSIEVINGNFDLTLAAKLKEIASVDYVFIDGNHRFEPTLRYFEQILPYTNQNSVLIFDDIYWSDEMIKAWKNILNHPKVSITIDLFNVGIVFLNPNFSKQNFILKY
jgi:predicted O-methyltransferase YrrM